MKVALPFVPRMFVRQQFKFNNIEGSNKIGIQAVTQLLEYFKTTWIDGHVHKQDIRTNNKLEGWYNSLNRSTKKAHPNIYELILTLKAEQASINRTDNLESSTWSLTTTNEKKIKGKRRFHKTVGART